MEFTYDSYRRLIKHIREHGYVFTDYESHKFVQEPCCIMRHDIDQSIEKEEDVPSTYFVLASSDFYNPASKRNRELLKKMAGGVLN